MDRPRTRNDGRFLLTTWQISTLHFYNLQLYNCNSYNSATADCKFFQMQVNLIALNISTGNIG